MNKKVLILYSGMAACMAFTPTRSNASSDPYPSREARRPSAGHTTYYVDPTNGDDKNPGTSKPLAWRTFAPVNQLLLSAGDRVEIVSPGSFNQTLMPMGTGTAKNPIEIFFAPGRYDFHPDKAIKRKYPISNTNDDPDTGKAVGILLEGARHFILTGSGADIFYRGKMIEVCLDRCENIALSGLSFDYHRPTVSEFRTIDVTPDSVDLEIHPDSKYKVVDGKIKWLGEGWSYTSGLAQELDLNTNEIKRRGDPLKDMKLEELKPFLVRARGKHNMKPERVYQIRQTRRDCVGVFTRRSKNITWKNVQFHFLHGMGIVTQFSENIAFVDVAVAPDEKSGRTCAAWADCLHFSSCRGKIIVKNVVFSGANDDAINIHGTHLRVVELLSSKQIKVRFMHKQTFGFMAFNAGDDIVFVKSDTLETFAPNRVKTAELINPKELLLTLDHSVPAKLNLSDAVENTTWTPDVEIRGCTVSRIPTRGFLLTTRGKVLVEENEFQHTRMSAILVANDAKNWYESGEVRNLEIRKNKFIQCGEPVIKIHPENNKPNDSVHQNIRITDNQFVLRNTTAIKAKSTRGLLISKNQIYSQKKLDAEQAITTQDCSDVKINRNTFKPLPPH